MNQILKKLVFPGLLVGLIVGLGVGSANAAVVVPFVASLGVHNDHFNDFSWEQQIVDVDGDGLLDVGDQLRGVFNIESIGVEGGTTGVNRLSTGQGAAQPVEVTGVFEAIVTAKTGGPGAFSYRFGPTATFEAIYGSGAMIAMFEDASKNFKASAPLAGAGNIFSIASDGLHLTTLGFTGAGGTATAAEGWRADTITDDTTLAALFGSTAFGSYQANLDRIQSAGFANDFNSLVIPKAKISLFDLPNLPFTQFSVNGQLFGTASGATLPLSDSADLFFRVTGVVPEPASCLIWAGILGLGAVGAYRKRNRKVA